MIRICLNLIAGAWGVQLNFPNDLWNVDAGFKDIGEPIRGPGGKATNCS